jgi:hypothetical protein
MHNRMHMTYTSADISATYGVSYCKVPEFALTDVMQRCHAHIHVHHDTCTHTHTYTHIHAWLCVSSTTYIPVRGLTAGHRTSMLAIVSHDVCEASSKTMSMGSPDRMYMYVCMYVCMCVHAGDREPRV